MIKEDLADTVLGMQEGEAWGPGKQEHRAAAAAVMQKEGLQCTIGDSHELLARLSEMSEDRVKETEEFVETPKEMPMLLNKKVSKEQATHVDNADTEEAKNELETDLQDSNSQLIPTKAQEHINPGEHEFTEEAITSDDEQGTPTKEKAKPKPKSPPPP